jgi:TetR/AcrR family transcriptional regulator
MPSGAFLPTAPGPRHPAWRVRIPHNPDRLPKEFLLSPKSSSRPPRKRIVRRPRGRPREARGDGVGAEAIMRAACALLVERAPGEITLALVAQTMRIDRSLIRYYFRNRSNLMLALAQHLYEQLKAEFRLTMVDSGDPIDRIRSHAGALLRFQVRHPYFHRLVMEEVANSTDPGAMAFMKSFTNEGLDTYRALADEAVKLPGVAPFDGAFLYLATIGLTELFATGAPFLRTAFGDDYDAVAVQRRYERFITSFVVDGLRRATG